jgi:hypothetical protein
MVVRRFTIASLKVKRTTGFILMCCTDTSYNKLYVNKEILGCDIMIY